MSLQSWQLPRRTFLRGVGVSLALPYLDCMASKASSPLPKRFCGVYFPYGIVQQKQDSEFARWNWFPTGDGKDYVSGDVLQPLDSYRDSFSVLGGLSHPHGRKMGGHDTADIWLTAAELKGSGLRNSISIDQLIARQHRGQTRFSSLVLSSDGGVGEPTRSSTLSFGNNGQPIPSMHRPRFVFDSLFGNSPDSIATQRQQLQNSSKMLDRVLEHSQSLHARLGRHDQRKFDEYLQSVREIEQRVERSEKWLDTPKPQVDTTGLHLDADDSTPRELIRTMYDLMFLAFQTDSTRSATYQIGNMNGATSIAGKFPQLLGIGNNMHSLAHGANKGKGGEAKGKWDQFLAEQLAYFVGRMQSTTEQDGTLLDRTILLYGSSNSNTHRNENYPLIVAGGASMGMHHGAFHRFESSTPMSNLFVTILNSLDVPTDAFVDSTGAVTVLS